MNESNTPYRSPAETAHALKRYLEGEQSLQSYLEHIRAIHRRMDEHDTEEFTSRYIARSIEEISKQRDYLKRANQRSEQVFIWVGALIVAALMYFIGRYKFPQNLFSILFLGYPLVEVYKRHLNVKDRVLAIENTDHLISRLRTYQPPQKLPQVRVDTMQETKTEKVVLDQNTEQPQTDAAARSTR